MAEIREKSTEELQKEVVDLRLSLGLRPSRPQPRQPDLKVVEDAEATIRQQRTKDLDTMELLNQLPAQQQVLYRLLNCMPQGAASYNVLIQHALSMVALESVKIYTAISDGTINLVDKFFEMQRNDAIRALDIYKRANQKSEKLSEFYEVCKSVHIGCRENYLKIEQVSEQPPPPTVEPEPEPVKEEPPKQEPKDLLLFRKLAGDVRSCLEEVNLQFAIKAKTITSGLKNSLENCGQENQAGTRAGLLEYHRSSIGLSSLADICWMQSLFRLGFLMNLTCDSQWHNK